MDLVSLFYENWPLVGIGFISGICIGVCCYDIKYDPVAERTTGHILDRYALLGGLLGAIVALVAILGLPMFIGCSSLDTSTFYSC